MKQTTKVKKIVKKLDEVVADEQSKRQAKLTAEHRAYLLRSLWMGMTERTLEHLRNRAK